MRENVEQLDHNRLPQTKMCIVSNNEIDLLNKDDSTFIKSIRPRLLHMELETFEDMMVDRTYKLEKQYLDHKAANGYARNVHKEYTMQYCMTQDFPIRGMFDLETLKLFKTRAQHSIDSGCLDGWILMGWAHFVESVHKCKNRAWHPMPENYYTILHGSGFFPKKLMQEVADLRNSSHAPLFTYTYVPKNEWKSRISKYHTFKEGTWCIKC